MQAPYESTMPSATFVGFFLVSGGGTEYNVTRASGVALPLNRTLPRVTKTSLRFFSGAAFSSLTVGVRFSGSTPSRRMLASTGPSFFMVTQTKWSNSP